MKKKIPFLPALHPRDDGFEKLTSLSIGDIFVPHRETIKLCSPDRSYVKAQKGERQWKLGSGIGNLFQNDVR
jgi:hypothetical protein